MTKALPPASEVLTGKKTVDAIDGGSRGLISKKWLPSLKDVLIACLYLLLVLPAIELFLSLSHIGEQEYLRLDPIVGFMHLRDKLVTDRTEAVALSQMNSQGLNDVEHNLAKEPGTVRVAVLGDSIVEALQVPIAERLTTKLQAILNDKTGRKFEVLNFGTGGYSTGQEYLQYLRIVQQYKPDIVLLVVHQGDEDENGPVSDKWSLRPTFGLNAAMNPTVRWQEFDTWRQSRSADPLTFFEWGRRHCHIWQALLQVHDSVKNDGLFKRLYNYATTYSGYAKDAFLAVVPSLKNELNEREITTATRLQGERAELCRNSGLMQEPGPQQAIYDSSQQWRLELRLLALFNSKCSQNGSKFFVATFPAVEKSQESRDVFERHLRSMRELAPKFGFEMLDLSSAVHQAPNQKTDPLFLLAHLSARGHSIVADELAHFIEPK